MALVIEPLSEAMGVAVSGIDLREPVSEADRKALSDAFEQNVVLCIRDQHLSGPEFITASRIFGELVKQVNEDFCVDGIRELGRITNDDHDVHATGKRLVRGTNWHTDHSFTETPPKATILYAVTVPKSGNATSFCNLRAAYAALPEDRKAELDGLRAVHQYRTSRNPSKVIVKLSGKTEPEDSLKVAHPIVRRHLPSGEKTLYLSRTRMDHIIGLDQDASDRLLDELMAHANRPEFHYHHQWREGDMVIWDNRCAMHHANDDYPAHEKRYIYRSMVIGEKPVPAWEKPAGTESAA
jgi:taurine dioxygenase